MRRTSSHPRSAGHQPATLRRWTGVALALLAAAAETAPALAPASAAPTSDSAASEIVVTGFRGSLARALTAKKEAAVAVDSILAEDIGIQITLMRGLKLTFEGINLTDQYQNQYIQPGQLQSVYHTGREFLAGLRFTL